MLALTSLSPAPERLEAQREAIASWRAAGLYVQCLQHQSEIDVLRRVIDVEIICCQGTTVERFGRHCVPVNTLAAHLATVSGAGLLINSDIVLRLSPRQMECFASACRGALGYLVKYNHAGDERRAVREPYGIDAFLFDPRAVRLDASWLSIGLPAWDYWLPYEFGRCGMPLYTTDDPVAFHRQHPQTWDMDRWDECAQELCRMYPLLVGSTPEQRLRLFQGLHAEINRAPRVQVLR